MRELPVRYRYVHFTFGRLRFRLATEWLATSYIDSGDSFDAHRRAATMDASDAVCPVRPGRAYRLGADTDKLAWPDVLENFENSGNEWS